MPAEKSCNITVMTCPIDEFLVQPLPDLGNGVERWTAYDGATNQIVQLQFTRS